MLRSWPSTFSVSKLPWVDQAASELASAPEKVTVLPAEVAVLWSLAALTNRLVRFQVTYSERLMGPASRPFQGHADAAWGNSAKQSVAGIQTGKNGVKNDRVGGKNSFYAIGGSTKLKFPVGFVIL